MCNDIWYLGQGNWAVYTEDSTVAEQLCKLDGIKMVAVYRRIKQRGVIAMQFNFCEQNSLYNSQSLLAEVCSIIELDLKRVSAMAKRSEYIPYSRKYYPDGSRLQLASCEEKKQQKN